MRFGSGIVMAGVLAMHLIAGAAMAEDVARLTVTGEGRSDAAPDMATITVGVSTAAKTAREALAENNARLGAVLEQLKAAGIEDRDVQTSGLSLGPVMDYSSNNRPKVTGYQASNQVTVRVRALDTLGTVLDQTVSDGANEFHGLSFGLAEPGPALDAARMSAVKDARRKAEMMAEAAGVKLGKLLSLSEQGFSPQPRMMMRAEAAVASDAVPVAAGEVSYALSVTAEWALEQ